MSKRTKMSIRGELVDFDKLQIMKKQILKKPKTEEIKNRERFIDKKRRRGTKNSIDKLLSQNVPSASTPTPNTASVESTPDITPAVNNEIAPQTIKKK